jgi:hypothetical protein
LTTATEDRSDMTTVPAAHASGRRLKLSGVLVMVLGLVLAGVSAAPIVRAFSNAFVTEFTTPVHTTPFRQVVELRKGKYLLLESTHSSRQVSPQAVRLIDSSGAAVTGIRQSGGGNRVDRDGEEFVDVVAMTVPHPGYYQLVVADFSQARMIVGRDPVDALASVGSWLLAAGAGALLFMLGFVLLLIGFGRNRPGHGRPVLVYFGQQPGFSPPGWYPDPHRPGGWRYWDGYRWQP